MFSTYRLRADELTADFVRAIKKNYRHKEIKIIVQDVEDETDYLLKSDANREHLLSAIKNVEEGEDLVSRAMDEL